MWHPFKSLVDKIMRGLEESFAENDHVSLAPRTPTPPPEKIGTKFERAMLKKFKTGLNLPDHYAVMVSIENGGDDYFYMDPLSRQLQNGTFHVSLLKRHERVEDAVRMENNVGKLVVMMLDLAGPPVEEQIPGWKSGTIHFPDRFLMNGVITVNGPIQTCRGAGIIVDGDQVRPSIVPIHVRNHHQAVQSAQHMYRDLPDFQPAFVKSALGKPVPAPRHIRGVFENDIERSQEPGMRL
jgi:hypothetical protein